MHGSYSGIEVLEGAVHLEDLYIAGEQSEWADISRLPRLERVNCQGAQALSGASNPHVRRLRLEVDRIPDGFTTSAAIEELWVSAGKSLRDLSCFTDLSQLTVLQVQRAARLDIGGLSEATNLKSLDLLSTVARSSGLTASLTFPNYGASSFIVCIPSQTSTH
jgi:hypothetical protein